jgi:hypothetical protein
LNFNQEGSKIEIKITLSLTEGFSFYAAPPKENLFVMFSNYYKSHPFPEKRTWKLELRAENAAGRQLRTTNYEPRTMNHEL